MPSGGRTSVSVKQSFATPVSLMAILLIATIGTPARAADSSQLHVLTSSTNGLASYVTPQNQDAIPVAASIPLAQTRPIDFFIQYGGLFGITDAENELVATETQTDDLGHTHTTFAQVHQGIPVFTGILKTHQDAALRFLSGNGHFHPISSKLNVVPTIALSDAVSIAQGQIPSNNLAVESTDLVIVDPGWYGDPSIGERLAYHIVLTEMPGLRMSFFVDAHTGNVLDSWDMICTLRNREIHNAAGSASLPGPVSRTEGQAPTGNATTDSAYDFAGDTYDYYLRAFGRDSIDGAGLKMVATVNSTAPQCPNAYWNGAQTVFCSGVGTDDVIGHEFTHAVTQYSAGLIYQNQSGQLNEAYSDIFGEMIDLFNGNAAFAGTPGGPPFWPTSPSGSGTDTPNNLRSACSTSNSNGVRWLVGEDSSAFGGAIRDMWNPTCFNHPDRAGSTLQTCNVNDAGGVHSGSGVLNHAFALATDGGTFNGYTITGVGPIKSGAVWYRALTVYLSAGSDFEDAYSALNQAAADLVGTTPNDPRTGNPSSSAITAANATEINKALLSVELNTVGRCGQTIGVLNSTAPSQCASRTVIYSDNFEDGTLSPWTVSHDGTPVTPYEWTITTTPLPFGQPGKAARCNDFGGNCSASESAVHHLDSPTITMPATLNFPTLAITHYIETEPVWDGCNIKLSVNGGAWTLIPSSAFYYNGYNNLLLTASAGSDNLMAGQPAWTGVGGQWGVSLAYLGGLVHGGDSVRIRLDLGKDFCTGARGWYVDDVSIYDCIDSRDCNNNGIPDEIETQGGGHPDVFVQYDSNHGQIGFSDVDGATSYAKRFTLMLGKTINRIKIRGVYDSTTTPPADAFTIKFHQNDVNGLPGSVISTHLDAPTRTAVDTISGGRTEYEFTFTLSSPPTFAPSTYWLEIYNNTTGDASHWGWSVGQYNSDVVSASANQAPGTSWTGRNFQLALELSGGIIGADADGDTVPDVCDGCPADPNKSDPGVCGCGVSDIDTDSDGTPDCNDGCPNDPNKLEPGICGCGESDADSDEDGTVDCQDGCPNDPNKIEPGVCGCNVADDDSDGDETPDCNDLCPDDPNKIEPGTCGCGIVDTTPDGDLNLDGNVDGSDIQRFVDALTSGSPAQSDICHGNFDGQNGLDFADVPGMVSALLGP